MNNTGWRGGLWPVKDDDNESKRKRMTSKSAKLLDHGPHIPSRLLRAICYIAIGAVAASLLVGANLAAAPASPAAAATAANWDPGYIIDDSIFYDTGSMDANAVQSFLNVQVSSCQGASYTCLKGYGVPTETRAADRYCTSSYQGAAYQTAAQIIDGVARACGINQRVLLVLLQKEQGLVTSSSPSAYAFAAATGMSCPDTAACDPQFSGFFYQVYFAARQYQVYRLNPTSFGFQAGRINNIGLNPNAGCGAQSVYIANQATAALYIYTPYTPNAAALGNLYGNGDGCSAYGNRNFWRIFSDWFGDPHRYTVADGLASYWSSQGGASGQMGNPISYLIVLEGNGGSYQRFQGGVAYASYQYGTKFVANNVFGAQYANVYGPTGPLGWPASEQMCAPNGVCFQSFAGGTVTTSAATGTQVVWGAIGQFWAQSGGPYSLGAALAAQEYDQINGSAWVQRFQGGTIAQSSAGTFFVPRSAIETAWIGANSGHGFYGWPAGASACITTSCAQVFQGGVLSTSVANGTHAILWGLQSVWSQSGGITGLGVALTDLRGSSQYGTGWVQQFSSAAVTLRPDGTTIQIPYGGVWNTWVQAGAEAGYGWPSGATTCVGTACGQRFQFAEITTSPQGNFAIVGGFTPAWETSGGLTSVGPAIVPLRYSQANHGGWTQQFGGGIITQTLGSAPIFTPAGPIINAWQHYGGELTWLGWPVSAQQCANGTCTQQFQQGQAMSNAGGVQFTR